MHSKILSKNQESYKPRRTGAVKASLYKNSERRSSQVSDNLNFIYDKSENRQKSAKNPSEWMPPNSSFHCEYVSIWIEIKYLWELTVTTAEYNFLESTLSSC